MPSARRPISCSQLLGRWGVQHDETAYYKAAEDMNSVDCICMTAKQDLPDRRHQIGLGMLSINTLSKTKSLKSVSPASLKQRNDIII
jgi:hypothetical protein